MGKHVAAWFTTFVLDMVAVLVLAFFMGDTGTALGMAAGGVALAGVAVAAAADGAVGGAALLLLVPVGLAAPVGAVTSAEVAAGRPVASVVRGDESVSGTTVPLVEAGLRSEVGGGEPGSSPCAEDPLLAGDTATCPPTAVSVPSDGVTEDPDGGVGGVDGGAGTEGGTEGGTDGGTDGGGGTDDTGGTGTGGGTDDGAGGLGGGPSSGASVGP